MWFILHNGVLALGNNIKATLAEVNGKCGGLIESAGQQCFFFIGFG